MVGAQIAIMHGSNTIHGDLTTSNMMFRLRPGSRLADLSREEVLRIAKEQKQKDGTEGLEWEVVSGFYYRSQLGIEDQERQLTDARHRKGPR